MAFYFTASACSNEPPAAGTCQITQDCLPGFHCVEGRCLMGLADNTKLDGGRHLMDVGFAPRLDAASSQTDSSASNPDAGRLVQDAAVLPDAEDHDAATWPDAEIRDAAIWPDANLEDAAFPLDAGSMPPDAGFVADSSIVVDAGPPPLASPGVYSFERVIVNGIGSNEELTNISIAPDGARMIVSQRYDDLHIIEVQTQTLLRTISLPGIGSASALIADVEYSSDSRFILIVATIIPRSGSRSARIYRADADGQNLVELSTARINGREFHAIAVDQGSGGIAVLSRPEGSSPSYLAIHAYDDTSRGFTSVLTNFTSAGCEDLAFINDEFGQRGLVYVCGYNGITLGHLNSTVAFVNGPGFGAASNTHRIAARPQGDYALAIEAGSTSKLSRFAQGVWSVGSSGAVNFGHTGMWNVAFSDDGARALSVGNFYSNSIRIKEYRHGFYSRAELTDVSISGFDQAPYLGRSGVLLSDVAWRPNLDCGYIVGGCSTGSCTKGYLIEFNVSNGRRACP
jgi:hypothetical protein